MKITINNLKKWGEFSVYCRPERGEERYKTFDVDYWINRISDPKKLLIINEVPLFKFEVTYTDLDIPHNVWMLSEMRYYGDVPQNNERFLVSILKVIPNGTRLNIKIGSEIYSGVIKPIKENGKARWYHTWVNQNGGDATPIKYMSKRIKCVDWTYSNGSPIDPELLLYFIPNEDSAERLTSKSNTKTTHWHQSVPMVYLPFHAGYNDQWEFVF